LRRANRGDHAQIAETLAPHADLYWAGYVQDAQKELVEACCTFALVNRGALPDPAALGIAPAPYLNGLGEAVGEARREGIFVLGSRCPGLLLPLAVIIGRELFHAGAKNLREQRRVGRQERPQREARMGSGHHRFTFQVVVPSFLSSSSMPIALSSFKVRIASSAL
jgi:hypothetical protein